MTDCFPTKMKRERAAYDEADWVVRVHVAPELAGLPQGTIKREAGETLARYSGRGAVLRKLLGAA